MCGRNVTIETINKLFKAIKNSDYKDCHNVQPCKSVIYTLSNPETKDLPPRFTDAKVFVTFENTMVENIMDSYDYTSISIFSEIGGSVGVLTGISCITIVEFLLGIQKKLFEIYQKRGKVTPIRVIKVKENMKGQLPEIRYWIFNEKPNGIDFFWLTCCRFHEREDKLCFDIFMIKFLNHFMLCSLLIWEITL